MQIMHNLVAFEDILRDNLTALAMVSSDSKKNNKYYESTLEKLIRKLLQRK